MLENVKVTTFEHIDDTLSFEHVIAAGKIGVESSVNNQDSKTPLYIAEEMDNLDTSAKREAEEEMGLGDLGTINP